VARNALFNETSREHSPRRNWYEFDQCSTNKPQDLVGEYPLPKIEKFRGRLIRFDLSAAICNYQTRVSQSGFIQCTEGTHTSWSSLEKLPSIRPVFKSKNQETVTGNEIAHHFPIVLALGNIPFQKLKSFAISAPITATFSKRRKIDSFWFERSDALSLEDGIQVIFIGVHGGDPKWTFLKANMYVFKEMSHDNQKHITPVSNTIILTLSAV